MDNQHRKITGYRELSQEEIDVMNEIKAKAAEVGELLYKLKAMQGIPEGTPVLDQRWVSIGFTELQQGFMALTRAVTKPDFF
jgi:hypothetical protein